MLRHRRASTNTSSSLTFVGSSENVGRVSITLTRSIQALSNPHVPRMHDITLTNNANDRKMIVESPSFVKL